MTSDSDSSFYPATWSYTSQMGVGVTEDCELLYSDEYSPYDLQNNHSFPSNIFDTAVYDYSDVQVSPSASSTSSTFTTPPIPGSPMSSYSAMQLQIPSSLPTHLDRAGRSQSYPPSRSHSRPAPPPIPKPEAPIRHETYEVETGEDEVFKKVIHRLSDEEKRGLNCPPSSRPTFFCLFDGCNRFLLHRAQVKPHLADHGYRFQKPYRCSCGAEFGRQVEAARHVEDKKECEKCHRSGRKYKGGSVCLRCLRHHHPGN